ncbi:MAG: NTP transferase domain-containing protein [Hungatella sp.]|nr:NTP transferase domain-containing protein [Hungatella sp.]
MIKSDQIIDGRVSLIEALNIMDTRDRKLLLICDGGLLQGVISIGDIQRALLGKKELSLSVLEFVRPDITVAYDDDDIESIKAKMCRERIETMPIIDRQNRLIDVIEWNQLFSSEDESNREIISYPVVIMAGGKGTRLLPLTNIIPKPLIPISKKSIIEEIMTLFKNVGCEKFYISVNYKKEIIEEYFSDKKHWKIEFIHEDTPLGTAGSLYLLKNRLNSAFFVINCDTLVTVKLEDLVEYHKTNNNVITVVSVVKRMSIPYGTIETEIGGIISDIKEKPEFVYQINSGMYILEPEALDYIEDNTFTNITDLIERLIKNNKRVGAFPVPENSWVDMGNWNEYLKLVDKFAEDK